MVITDVRDGKFYCIQPEKENDAIFFLRLFNQL